MKATLLLCAVLGTFLYSDTYYAKLEPLETYSYKAAVSGEVLFANSKLEGSLVNDEIILKMDDSLNVANAKELKEMLQSTKERVEALEEVARIKKENYEKVKNLATKSKFEKDNELTNYLNAKTQALSTKEQMHNTKISLDRELDAIKNKTLKLKNLYLYKVHVKKGDYVTSGAKLFDAMDISKGKLTFFLTREDAAKIDSLDIFLNGDKTSAKPDKILIIADSEYISSYRAELIVPAGGLFSNPVKIELRSK